MDDAEADMEPVIAAAPSEDRDESVSLMEPLLVPEGSHHRAGLTDLAIELAAERYALLGQVALPMVVVSLQVKDAVSSPVKDAVQRPAQWSRAVSRHRAGR